MSTVDVRVRECPVLNECRMNGFYPISQQLVCLLCVPALCRQVAVSCQVGQCSDKTFHGLTDFLAALVELHLFIDGVFVRNRVGVEFLQDWQNRLLDLVG